MIGSEIRSTDNVNIKGSVAAKVTGALRAIWKKNFKQMLDDGEVPQMTETTILGSSHIL